MSLEQNTSLLSPVWARYTNIVVERGEGAYLYDTTGRQYLDFTCGIGVTNTGHCHPRVVEAIREQAGLLLHGQANIVYHKPMLSLVESLKQILDPSLDCYFFTNSGAEAVESAVKLARHATGRNDIIVFQGGFHGRTAGAMALTSSKGKYRSGFGNMPSGVHFAPYAAIYNSAVLRAAGKDVAALSAAAPYVEEGYEEPLEQLRHVLQMQTTPDDVAAILLEPVQGEGGYIVPPLGFVQGLRQICDEYGILLIADEVQTGFGRTGTFFAHERFGVVPDILLMAKGLASGLPLSGVVARRELMERWHAGSHGGTYGGNALACAAAVATIATIREEGLVQNAERMGAVLKQGLLGLQQRYSTVGDVRGLGLMIGVELVDSAGKPNAALCKHVLASAREQGLLLLNCGPYDNVLRFIPPLIVDEQQIAQSLQIVEHALASA
jgi:4-aminobutyrate aminotransferase